MERENILVILYEMAMAIGGETKLAPLLTRTLQRLLYHTSFPAGFVCLDLPPPAAGEETIEVRLDAIVGDFELMRLAGQPVRLPAALLRGAAERAENAALLARLPGVGGRYRVFLRLPIDGSGAIVLLAPQMPETDLPLTSIFQPIMANLARAIVLCRHHEDYDAGLVAERDVARRGLERFRAAMDTSPDCVFLIDPRTLRFVDVNRMTERLLGYTRDELLALGPQDLARGKTREDFVRLFDELAHGPPEGSTLEAACRHKDGSEHPVEARFTLSAPLVIAVARDVTERKKAEAALRESEARYRTLAENLPGIVYRVHVRENNRMQFFNRAAIEVTGYAAEELATGDVCSLDPLIVSEDRERVIATVRYAIAEGRPFTVEYRLRHKGGGIRHLLEQGTPIAGLDGKPLYIDGVVFDVTERRHAEQEVARSKELLERMFESIHVLVAYMDRDFNFIRVNRAYAAADGRTPEFFPGKNHFALYPGKDVETIFRRVVETGEPYVAIERPFEYAEHPERGVSYWDWRVEPVRGADGQAEGIIFSLLNVTERVQARQALTESEEKFRRISAAAQDAVIMLDDEGRIVYWNPAAERIFGYRADEVSGKGMHGLFAPARYRAAYEKGFAAFRASGEGAVIGKTLELEALRKDGSEFPIELSVSALRLKGKWHAVGILRDSTARKRAEENIRRLSRQNQLILDSVGEGIYGVDLKGRCTFVNPAAAKILGYAPEEILGRPAHELFHHTHADGSPYPAADCPVQKAHSEGSVYRGADEVYWRKDGSSFPIEYVSMPIREDGRLVGAVVSFLDITGRQRAEAALRRSEDSLKEAQRIVHLGSWELGLVTDKLAWSDEIFRIFEIDPTKFGASYEAFLNAIHPDDREFVNRAYTESVRNRTSYDIVHRLLMKDGRIKFVNERCRTFYDEGGKPLRSLGTIQDITERVSAEQRLRTGLERTVEAIAATIEMRDPYTAGHERRVVELATAIARELGLAGEKIDGLHFAALVHDIGKIHIPAEILSKPAALSPIEFEMMKSHCQVGYDILKGIEFPWPVARIVLEHHERLDGTGYPNGLKGEQTLLESKILAVADVVEAMSSHRPYRPALGIDAALDEIVKHRGTRYEPQVVDACLRVFRERSFRFS